ncbi:AfsR/SARP family transcriptional regulator [Desulfovirgula thermocuniculi]|uniref:AfsR/SARP family transcriptional regulator n=1 Tax=Desulfovirgula thermocuniculi TaxID=348842 RepID=UPI00146F9600|nr:bacterial transcriptional activator domain-containing protein [Desulfovirgula thermocuniculi]
MRTGRLHAAIKLLEEKRESEGDGYRPPLSFRETPLLLSLLYSLTGEADKAVAAAEEGIRLGQKLKSPFVEAIGYVRMGHALMVQEKRPSKPCHEAYERALVLNDNLGVVRGRTEVLMGRCLLYGYEGDWLAARRCGLEGVEVTEKVRDRWFVAVLYHSLGIAAACCRKFEEAKVWFARARELFSCCGDSFGKAVSSWWLAYLSLKEGKQDDFCRNASEMLELCENLGYDFLLDKATLWGTLDPRASVLILREAKRLNICAQYAEWHLKKLGDRDDLPSVGYTLRIKTLGCFRVWRGEEEIGFQEWRREAARRLFQLLITKRKTLLHKEEIACFLWPDADPQTASRDLKVALSTLLCVLEPSRQPRSPSFFIQRQGNAYYFNLASGYWLDAEEFETLVVRAEKIVQEKPFEAELLLKRALDLYEGDYLQGATQDEWCLEERERLLVLYIQAAEMLARLLAARHEYHECINWADKILEKDPCWEEAYRLKMYCYAKMGNKPMVMKIFNKCTEVLRRELNVSPSPKTVKLFKKIVNQPVSL